MTDLCPTLFLDHHPKTTEKDGAELDSGWDYLLELFMRSWCYKDTYDSNQTSVNIIIQ